MRYMQTKTNNRITTKLNASTLSLLSSVSSSSSLRSSRLLTGILFEREGGGGLTAPFVRILR